MGGSAAVLVVVFAEDFIQHVMILPETCKCSPKYEFCPWMVTQELGWGPEEAFGKG